jgi:hypothetical protein
MPEPPASCAPVVYQLRVVLWHISPLIWRRLLVRGDSTIAALHATVQTAFGWSDEHLHRFVIHGREYGVGYLGGLGFRDDPHQVRLGQLGLRVGERFRYEYDFTDGWQHDVRVEQVLPLEPGRTYPRCVGGHRAAPPEDCGGPWAFLELRQHYSPVRIAKRLLDIYGALTGEQPHDQDRADELDERDRDDHAEELDELVRWLRIDRFDRRAVNRQLAELGQQAARTAA